MLMTSHNLFFMLDDAIVGLVLFFCSELIYTKLIDILSLNTLFFIFRYFMAITFDFIVVLRDSLSN